MKRQTRPFVVEVKHRRGGGKKKGHSIWGDLDIAAVTAETTLELEQNRPTSPAFIDSDAPSIDATGNDNPPPEHNMPDPQEAETTDTTADAPGGTEAAGPKKKAPRPRKTKPASKVRIAKDAATPASKSADIQPASARTKRKTYSEKERAQKLAQIETSIGRGASIKSAVGEAGISEQTYYQWKKASQTEAPADDLKDLLLLEEENKRLKKQLAEHLRQENAELRRKLGLS